MTSCGIGLHFGHCFRGMVSMCVYLDVLGYLHFCRVIKKNALRFTVLIE